MRARSSVREMGLRELVMTDRRLLVVDDVEELGDMVALVASDMGYEAKAVTHAQEFMDTMDVFKPDTVVIDIVMPDIDGFEVVKWLRDRGCKAKVVVASTANLNYAKLAKSLGKGRGLDISVVEKPYKINELITALA